MMDLDEYPAAFAIVLNIASRTELLASRSAATFKCDRLRSPVIAHSACR